MRITEEQLKNLADKGLRKIERHVGLPKNSVTQIDSVKWVTPATQNEKRAKEIIRGNKPKMNKTESSYAMQLEALKQAGEIFHYGFEEVTLKLADGVRFTPDFIVVRKVELVNLHTNWITEFHETKGGFIRDDARIKFQVARKQFPFFRFKMMQYKDKQWNEIYPE